VPRNSRTIPKDEIGSASDTLVSWSGLADSDERVPELTWPQSSYTYHWMRTDAQLDALWSGLIMPIRRMRWVLNPNGARDETVERIAHDLNIPIKGVDPGPKGRQKGRFNHDEHLRLVFLRLVYGHMFFEKTAVLSDTDGKFHLAGVSPRLPRSISELKVDPKTGELISLTQHTSGKIGVVQEPIPRRALAAYIQDREGANWLGRSFFRPLYKHYLVKDRLMRVDAIKHERNGAGTPIIEAAPNATPKQLAALDRLAQSYKVGEASGGAIPHGTKLRLVGVEGAIPDTIASIRYHDEQMARKMLMMFMQLGTTTSGSRAMSDSFIDFFALSQEGHAHDYASTFNEEIIEDLVDWNEGIDESAPLLEFEVGGERDLAIADLVNLIDSGAVTVDDEMEKWIRQRYKMPDFSGTRPEPVAPVAVPAVAAARRRLAASGGRRRS
jgi:hypothetical protein